MTILTTRQEAEVISGMSDDLKVVNAARVSFKKESLELSTGDIGLINYLATHGHWTPFSHVRYTFSVQTDYETIGRFLMGLSQEDVASMVWRFCDGVLSIRTSLIGWANVLDHDNLHLFRGIEHNLLSMAPVSAEKLGIVDYGLKWTTMNPAWLINDPYFIDITMREKCPIFVARQRFKHMVGHTYNEVSRRYVDDIPQLYEPTMWRGKADNKKQGSTDQPCEKFYEVDYDESVLQQEIDCVLMYEKLVDDMKLCPEQARMVLPQSMMTEYYVTANLAAWNRMLKQRLDGHAQKEIRDLAEICKLKLTTHLNGLDYDLFD